MATRSLRWWALAAGVAALTSPTPPPRSDRGTAEVSRRRLVDATVFGSALLLASSPACGADPTSSSSSSEATGSSFIDSLAVPLRGQSAPLRKFTGKANLAVNIKMDDPVAGPNFSALRYLSLKYAPKGLRVWAFPTDQGYYEPDVAEMIRYKAYQQYGFGLYPAAVVFDKVDVVGKTAHPLWTAIEGSFPDPNGVNRVSLNFEKFLLDASGRVLRRYPRKFTGYDFEDDILAVLEDRALPDPTPDYEQAWVDAKRDAQRGEYSFRVNYNVYDQSDANTDWAGLAELSFQ